MTGFSCNVMSEIPSLKPIDPKTIGLQRNGGKYFIGYRSSEGGMLPAFSPAVEVGQFSVTARGDVVCDSSAARAVRGSLIGRKVPLIDLTVGFSEALDVIDKDDSGWFATDMNHFFKWCMLSGTSEVLTDVHVVVARRTIAHIVRTLTQTSDALRLVARLEGGIVYVQELDNEQEKILSAKQLKSVYSNVMFKQFATLQDPENQVKFTKPNSRHYVVTKTKLPTPCGGPLLNVLCLAEVNALDVDGRPIDLVLQNEDRVFGGTKLLEARVQSMLIDQDKAVVGYHLYRKLTKIDYKHFDCAKEQNRRDDEYGRARFRIALVLYEIKKFLWMLHDRGYKSSLIMEHVNEDNTFTFRKPTNEERKFIPQEFLDFIAKK